jgi:hypothetical protein
VAEVYSLDMRKGGARVEGTKGSGTMGPTRAVYRLSCQMGMVVMVVEDLDLLRQDADFVRDLLPAYVAAESERIGCGPVRVKVPAP